MRTDKGVPRSVFRAYVLGDRGRLSRLGKYGAKKRKQLAQKRAEEKRKSLELDLACADSIAQEAHEDICPLPD